MIFKKFFIAIIILFFNKFSFSNDKINRINYIEPLPNEMKFEIFKKLSVYEIIQISKTNSHFKELAITYLSNKNSLELSGDLNKIIEIIYFYFSEMNSYKDFSHIKYIKMNLSSVWNHKKNSAEDNNKLSILMENLFIAFPFTFPYVELLEVSIGNDELFSEKHLELISKIPTLNALKIINLPNHISVNSLKNLKKIRNLTIQGGKFTANDFNEFDFNNLNSLTVYSDSFTGELISIISNKFNNLESLSFNAINEIKNYEINSIKNLKKLVNLEFYFEFVDTPLNGEFLNHLSQLKTLSISAYFSDDFYNYLGKHKSIENLIINSTTPITNFEIEKFLGMSQLKQLNLPNSHITDHSFIDITNHFKSLKILSLSDLYNIQSSEISRSAFLSLLKLEELEQIELFNVDILGEGLHDDDIKMLSRHLLKLKVLELNMSSGKHANNSSFDYFSQMNELVKLKLKVKKIYPKQIVKLNTLCNLKNVEIINSKLQSHHNYGLNSLSYKEFKDHFKNAIQIYKLDYYIKIILR